VRCVVVLVVVEFGLRLGRIAKLFLQRVSTFAILQSFYLETQPPIKRWQAISVISSYVQLSGNKIFFKSNCIFCFESFKWAYPATNISSYTKSSPSSAAATVSHFISGFEQVLPSLKLLMFSPLTQPLQGFQRG
jgi:hypothetical protein